MTQSNLPQGPSSENSIHSHSHNLSINSVSSVAEPMTPPSSESTPKSYFWDSNKLNGNLVLPSFSLESFSSTEQNHSRNISVTSCGSDKENKPVNPRVLRGQGKVDKEYLTSISKVSLTQLRGDILRLAKDQHGCRFLQKRIDESYVSSLSSRQSNYEIIFEQVKASLYELIIDPFGNYLIQKLIEYFKEVHLDFCLNTLKNNMFSISINQHGTRALQKIIESISTEYQLGLLVEGLEPYIIGLIKDLNGNHVIQKVLNKYSPEKCHFIYESILEDLLVVATHKHGCCVLQKCLNHVTAAQHTAFANVILNYDNFSRLVNDQFGNYVLQYLISIDSIDVNCKLYQNILDYGVEGLCVLKFSSNVIEKLMISCYENETKSSAFSTLKFTIIKHLLYGNMNKLINNAYGNYVVQTLIEIMINSKAVYFIDSPKGERMLLPALKVLLDDNFQSSVDSLQVQLIKKWFHNCKIDSTFGKKIQSKINCILNGSGKAYQKKSPHGSSSSLQFSSELGTELYGNRAIVQPLHNHVHGIYQPQKVHRLHDVSNFRHNATVTQQSVPNGSKRYNPLATSFHCLDDENLHSGFNVRQISRELPSSSRFVGYSPSATLHPPPRMQNNYSVSNGSCSVLEDARYFSSKSLDNTNWVGYQNTSLRIAGSHAPNDQMAISYEQGNNRVANSSLFHRWSGSSQQY